MDCTLFPDDDPSIFSFNSETAEVRIQTDDKSLHDTVLDLNIFCVNPRSGSATSVDFSVTFRDPCYDATLTLPPLPTTWTSTLWQESFTAFSPATTDTTGCGAPTYVITGLTDPTHYVETRLTQTGLVSLPFDTADVGTTTFSVKACYIFAGTQVCSAEQTNLQMEVINPCPQTQIIPESIDRPLAAMQGLTDTYVLTTWVWEDTIGDTNSAEFGSARCGPKSYTIRDSLNNEVDYVTLYANGDLILAPSVSDPIGIHLLTLEVSIDDYTRANSDPITASRQFTVTINKCTATISTGSSAIGDVNYHKWGSTDDSIRQVQPFGYTSSGCALDFTYTVQQKLANGDLVALPFPEISFNSVTGQIVVQKCDPDSGALFTNDPECTQQAYFKEYTVVVTGTLNDVDATSSSVEFDVLIGPDCDNDTLAFGQSYSSQISNFILRKSGIVNVDLDPQLTQ